MEGVGARLGRSSTRYGPATVFTGPVRRWKKKWVNVPPPNSHHHHHQTAANGGINGSNGATSHLLLYKWTPLTPSQNKENNNNDKNNSNNDNGANDSKKDDVVAAEEPPRRKFKYIPVAVLEEQKNEPSEQDDDEAKQTDTDMNTVEATSKGDEHDEKPDINDVPMDDDDENQAPEHSPVERQDLNVSTLDLSLGLNAHDDGNDIDSKAEETDN